MISDAQSKQLTRWTAAPAGHKLSAMEKGMLAWAVLDPKDRVLDVTCKQGSMLEAIQKRYDCEVCGTAETMEQVRLARQSLTNADIVYGLAEDVPWQSDAFDVVFFDATGRSLKKSGKCLLEIARVLKAGGQLVLGSRRAPGIVRSLAGMFIYDDQDAGALPGLKDILSAVKEAGFTHPNWHQLDLTKGVLTCWKQANVLE